MIVRRRTMKGRQGGRGWLLGMVLGILSLMVMGLVLVWTNIERMDTTFFINRAQSEIRERREHLAKLEVEKERLLSPYELRRKATEYGLHAPKTGQIRQMNLH